MFALLDANSLVRRDSVVWANIISHNGEVTLAETFFNFELKSAVWNRCW